MFKEAKLYQPYDQHDLIYTTHMSSVYLLKKLDNNSLCNNKQCVHCVNNVMFLGN